MKHHLLFHLLCNVEHGPVFHVEHRLLSAVEHRLLFHVEQTDTARAVPALLFPPPRLLRCRNGTTLGRMAAGRLYLRWAAASRRFPLRKACREGL